jgi:solute carrier family 5 (sodium-coupled monocarboxylate transporter), member 8/12
LSSLSTGLNALSAVIVEDFVKVLFQRKITALELQLWMRGVVIVFGVVSVLLILVVRQIDGIMQLAMSFSSCTLGPLLGIFVLGLIFPWVSSKSAFFAGLLSFVVTLANGIRTQLAIINREVVFMPKPVSVAGCLEEWSNVTTTNPVNYYTNGQHLSYIYYGLFGVVSCCLLGNFFVLIFGRNNTKMLNPVLVAPFMRKSLT